MGANLFIVQFFFWKLHESEKWRWGARITGILPLDPPMGTCFLFRYFFFNLKAYLCFVEEWNTQCKILRNM